MIQGKQRHFSKKKKNQLISRITSDFSLKCCSFKGLKFLVQKTWNPYPNTEKKTFAPVVLLRNTHT